jgi:hypothetical protein
MSSTSQIEKKSLSLLKTKPFGRAVPNVNKESAYYLRMKDDFGHTYSSPIFTLTCEQLRFVLLPFFAPSFSIKENNKKPRSDIRNARFFFTLIAYLQNENNPAAVPPDVAQQPQSVSDQAPISSPNGSANSSNPAPSLPGDPTVPSPAPGPSYAAVPHPVATSGPLVAAAHSAPPTAALAIPLSLAGAIIVLAGGLALHHRRRLAVEKERAREKLARSTSRLRSTGLALNLGSCGRGGGGIYRGVDETDVEKALFARGDALFGGGADGSFPDHAVDAYYSHAAAGPAPLYPYYAPEARQRTRHLAVDLLPGLGYRRPRPPPPPLPSSASSSLHRGYVDRNRSRGSGSRNGGGSLWRSLSISRHRRKVPPPSTLASSPSMTESVTLEVLPSYFPSPDFVDHGHRGLGAGDFENVPLSPPPLHTRDEAAEPEDPRMKDLRGVYEAVARALGSTRSG